MATEPLFTTATKIPKGVELTFVVGGKLIQLGKKGAIFSVQLTSAHEVFVGSFGFACCCMHACAQAI